MFSRRETSTPISIVAKTDIGKRRETNEDSVSSIVLNLQSHETNLNCAIVVLADGVGGYEMGEIASDVAVKKFTEVIMHEIFASHKNKFKIEYRQILIEAIREANREVCLFARSRGNRGGTTLVGAIIADNYAYIVNVGDSRAYLVSPKKSVVQITKDHSAVQEMVDAKMITEEQARNHPRKNIITQSLGSSFDLMPDVFEEKINGQTLMLCSDGLTNMLDDEMIANSINGDINKSAEELIRFANAKGGLDNISVILANYLN